MRLYPKKLRNIEDLEREKKLLRKQSRELDKEEFLSLEGLLGKSTTKDKKKKKKDDDESSSSASFVDLIPISNPLIKTGLKILESRLLNRRGGGSKEKIADAGPRKNYAKIIAVEFIGGYLKWKAIELSYKGIKTLVKRGKERKAEELRARQYVRFQEQRAPRK